MAKLLTFEKAIKQTDDGKRHLLLGNGFSRACRNDLFAYDALFSQGKDELTESAQKAFDILETTDFESVMRALKQAVELLKVYAPKNRKLAKRLAEDADKIRDVLAQAITYSHPERPNAIEDKEFAACRKFLSHFNKIYTLNYDLLLYWALMNGNIEESTLSCNDGFHQPDDGPADYVQWDLGNVPYQNIFYLHGALHIFDAGAEVHKYTWCNTGIALVDQIRDALNQNRYPIYVAEGTSKSKMNRIQHSAFLSRAYRSFSNINNSLFIFGHSLSDNDEHILRMIENGKVTTVYISIFGSQKSKDNKKILARAERLKVARDKSRQHKKLTVKFFNAASAEVWG